ncbi:odorant receptor 4-like [Photinus pyralis]|uniref:odorant receptor 4-like n=1 Tax=Photinus pyralis TaxID=7054 RepID=UPI001266F20A|nr:odorant receptor 4-like [Photinus pyralis]
MHVLKEKTTDVFKGDGACPLAPVLWVLALGGWFFSTNGNGLPFGSMPEWTLDFIGYAGCFLCQVLVYLATCHEYLLINVLKVCAMTHLRMHFKHLSMNLKEIVENAKEVYCQERGLPQSAMVSSDIPWKYLHSQMKGALTYHESLMKIAEVIETIFNRCILFNFIILSVFTCLILYLLVDCPIFSIASLRLIFYLLMGFLPFFIDCYLSNVVMIESAEIAYSCYQIDFIGTDLRFQKMIIMVIGRWQKSVKFTIGKFAPLEIATSLTVAKASISYFMLLQNLKKV